MSNVSLKQDETFPVAVDNRYLMNMDESYAGTYTYGRVIGFAAYKDEAVTAHVLFNNGAIFSYLPMMALYRPNKEATQHFELEDLQYKNSPGGRIDVTVFDALRFEKVNAFLPKTKVWKDAKYVCTLDWIDDNEQMNVVELKTGQFAALPNHKVLFGEFDNEPEFPIMKKLKQSWSVNR